MKLGRKLAVGLAASAAEDTEITTPALPVHEDGAAPERRPVSEERREPAPEPVSAD